jgi:hypothetical protein
MLTRCRRDRRVDPQRHHRWPARRAAVSGHADDQHQDLRAGAGHLHGLLALQFHGALFGWMGEENFLLIRTTRACTPESPRLATETPPTRVTWTRPSSAACRRRIARALRRSRPSSQGTTAAGRLISTVSPIPHIKEEKERERRANNYSNRPLHQRHLDQRQPHPNRSLHRARGTRRATLLRPDPNQLHRAERALQHEHAATNPERRRPDPAERGRHDRPVCRVRVPGRGRGRRHLRVDLHGYGCLAG